MNEQALALVQKLNVTPEDNETSKALVAQAAEAAARLDGLSGAEFDKAYVENEVAYHKAVNAALLGELAGTVRAAAGKQVAGWRFAMAKQVDLALPLSVQGRIVPRHDPKPEQIVCPPRCPCRHPVASRPPAP